MKYCAHKIKKCNNKYKLPHVLISLGMLCLNGCAVNETFCPPFPKADIQVVQELKLCPLDKMPYLLDWMNKIFVLQQQLNT